MNIKKNLAIVVSLSALISTYAAEPTITDVTAQQRYPWNGKIDISYKVTGDIAAEARERGLITSLKVTATDESANKTYTATKLSGDMALTAGTHSLIWDLGEDGIPIKSSSVVFQVSCEKTPATYCVIDLSGGTSASSYPVSYLTSPPTSGGFNADVYKTTKLVLRRIEPGSFMMCGKYNVTLTKPFYCGVFEVTQRQYELVVGSRPSYFKNVSYYATRPVEQVSYDNIRGSSNGAQWPASAAVDANSFVGKFRARTQIDCFDLPTEAQWEYACRAGTTTDFNNGTNLTGADKDANLKNLGRYKYNGGQNGSEGGGTDSGTAKVGSYQPNAWGLYDMHGNVSEWCLDGYGRIVSGVEDPVGSSTATRRIVRGGCWYFIPSACTSSRSSVVDYSSSFVYYYNGFRIVRTLSSVETAGTLCAGTVSWTGEGGGADHTVTTPEEVPYSYFDNDYPSLLAEYGGDYEAAALATAANGHNKVWECFVAGISPTNATSVFTAKINMVDGAPVVKWEPDLNTNGVIRAYKVYGKETLDGGGEWQYPTNSLHRFFKVTVEMP